MKKRRVVPKRAELLKRLKEGERKKIKSSALLQKFEQLVKWLAYQQYGREVLTEQEMLKVCRRAAKILLEKPFVPRETKLDALKGSRFIYVAGLDSLNKRCFKKFPYRWKSFLRTGLRVEIHTIIGSPLYGPLLRGSVARVKVVPDREKWLKVPEIANALRYRRIRDYSSHVKDSIGYVACKFHKVSNNNYALVIWNIQHRGQSLPRWFASRCKNWEVDLIEMLETLAKKAGAKYVAVPKGDLFLRFFKDFYPEDKLKKLAEEYRRFENKFREMGYKSADIALKVPFFKIPLTQPTEVNVTDYMLWKELK